MNNNSPILLCLVNPTSRRILATRVTIIILLVVTCIMFIGSINILARDPGRDLDIEEIFLSTWNGVVALLCVSISVLMVRWIIQVQLSRQIILSFFFYGWRNSVYDGAARRFMALFPSLETETSF